MNVGTLKATVAAYLHRDPNTFIVNGVDLLLRATNKARKWAERRVNFELSRITAKVPSVHITDGGLLSTAVLLDDADPPNPVKVKTVELAFLQFRDGQGAFPIEVITRSKHMQAMRRHFDEALTIDPKDTRGPKRTAFFSLVRHGDHIYVRPPDVKSFGGQETFPIFMDIIRWLDEYTADVDTDFLIEHCEDFMTLRTLYELNFFLKEDERFAISSVAMAEVWDSVNKWNSSMILNSAEDANLD